MEFRFTVDRPKMEKRARGAGEDAPAVAKDGILIVCDGAGATGQSKHEIDGKVHTSAYLGSRKTSEAAEAFLTENYDIITNAVDNPEALKQIVTKLGNTIRKALVDFVKENDLKLTVVGRTFKLLPTTLAAVVYKIYEDRVDLIVFSAGDSRVLLWEPEKGLQQLSVDDIDETADAFTDICNITNCISADFDFRLNYTVYSLPLKQFILFATSDGFTDSAKPFDQERIFLQSIGLCQNSILNEETSELSATLGNILDRHQSTGKDDCSISGLIYGFEGDGELINCIRPRYTYTKDTYSVPFAELNKRSREAMDRYNNAQSTYRIRQNKVQDKLKRNVLKSAEYLVGEGKESQPEVYAFLTAFPFIAEEERRINLELQQKKNRLTERAAQLKDNLLKEFVEIVRHIGFFPADDSMKPWFSPYILSQIRVYLQNSVKRTESYEGFNRSLKRLKEMPLLDPSRGTAYSFEEMFELCDSLMVSAGVINEVNSLIQGAEKSISDYFTAENTEILSHFERGLEDGFTEFGKLIEGLDSSKRIFGINIPTFKPSDADQKFRQLKNRFLDFKRRATEYANAVQEAQKADLSDEQKKYSYQRILEKNVNEIIERVKLNDRMYVFFAEEEKAEFDLMLSNVNMAEEETRNLIALKNDMWKKYKQDYELFTLADIKANVSIPKEIQE